MEEKELIKEIWKEKDIPDFIEYIQQLGRDEKACLFEKRIVNTNLKCIAVASKEVDKIVKLIYKGNFLSFIDLWIVDNYSCLVIIGKLISKIKDFELLKTYLLKYLTYVDCWGGTDCVKIDIKNQEQDKFVDFSKQLLKSQKTFERRMGLILLFKIINENHIDEILKICNSLFDENEYYVNMANAWLIAECFAKFREKTLNLIEQKSLNKFVQNKAICKCSDSFRISKQDKELLKKYRISD